MIGHDLRLEVGSVLYYQPFSLTAKNVDLYQEFHAKVGDMKVSYSGELPDCATHQDLIEDRRHPMEGHSAKLRDRLIWV